MKRLLILLILFLLVSNVIAAELPDPTSIYKYNFSVELLWGTLLSTSTVWVPISSRFKIKSGVVGIHDLKSKFGNQKWEMQLDSTNKVLLEFVINKNSSPTNNLNYQFYRMRVIYWIEDSKGIIISEKVTSLASNWKIIHTKTKKEK
jgi:hypothetical protein